MVLLLPLLLLIVERALFGRLRREKGVGWPLLLRSPLAPRPRVGGEAQGGEIWAEDRVRANSGCEGLGITGS
jgi:hypothetical protein